MVPLNLTTTRTALCPSELKHVAIIRPFLFAIKSKNVTRTVTAAQTILLYKAYSWSYFCCSLRSPEQQLPKLILNDKENKQEQHTSFTEFFFPSSGFQCIHFNQRSGYIDGIKLCLWITNIKFTGVFKIK